MFELPVAGILRGSELRFQARAKIEIKIMWGSLVDVVLYSSRTIKSKCVPFAAVVDVDLRSSPLLGAAGTLADRQKPRIPIHTEAIAQPL